MGVAITYRAQVTNEGTSLQEFVLNEAFIEGSWVSRSPPKVGYVIGHRVLQTAGSATEVTEFNMREGTGGTKRLAYNNSVTPEPLPFLKAAIGRGVKYEVDIPSDLKFELSCDDATVSDVEIEIEAG